MNKSSTVLSINKEGAMMFKHKTKRGTTYYEHTFKRVNLTVAYEFPSIFLSNENSPVQTKFYFIKIFGTPFKKSQHQSIYVAPFNLFSVASFKVDTTETCDMCGGPFDECEKHKEMVGTDVSEWCSGMTDDPSYN
jgi:hypothetical protein